MKKALMSIGIIAIAAVMVLSVGKDTIAKVAVEKGVEMVTGLKLSVRSLNIGVVKTLVDIKDLKLFNPKEYPDRVMLDMPEIYVEYDLPGIFRGKVHLKYIRIDLKEFVVVKNKKGELNLDSLEVVKEYKSGKKEDESLPPIQIDVLELKVGRVLYKDYSKGAKPLVQEFMVDLEGKYTNITDPDEFVTLIVTKALNNTTVARLANFDLQGLQGTLDAAQKVTAVTVAKAGKTVVQATQKTQQVVTGTTGDVVKSTAGVLKSTTDGVKSVVPLPFGTKKETVPEE